MNKERPRLHFKEKNNYIIHVSVALIPLIIYGFYKNGLLPFLNNDISLFKMFQPLFLPLMGILAGVCSDYLNWHRNKEKQLWTYSPFYGLIISMTMPVSINAFLVFFLITGMLWLFQKLKQKTVSPLYFTQMALMIVILIINISFQNGSERNHEIVYSMLDIFLGRNIGGISTTSIFLNLLSLGYLWFDPFYKKEIAISTILSFMIIAFLFEIFLPTGDYIFTILNSSIFFGSIFFATEIKSSPYMEQAKIIYGILIGVFCYCFTRFVSREIGIYLSIFLISLLVPILNLITLKIAEKKTSFVEKEKVIK